MLIVKPVTLRLRLLATMFLVFASPPMLAASFDCAKAQSKVEKLICGNPAISELDGRLGKVYQGVLEKVKPEEKQALANEQKHWLSQARNVCAKETCLKHAYWSRLAALETYFEPRSPLYKKESDKADAIQQVLATAPLYPSYDTPFCRAIFDDLKQIKSIRFVDPVVQTQSYEDPALDPWKKQCQVAPPFNFSRQCGTMNFESEDADDSVNACKVDYGLPPFKLYELPPVKGSSEKRHIFYADDAYGPMNQGEDKPHLGGGYAGFRQIHIARCLSVGGNYWEKDGKTETDWNGVSADAGQGGRNGKNYNSIIEYKGLYYFLVLHEAHGNFWLNVTSTDAQRPTACRWSPVKPIDNHHR
jgi:uncharacterized protein